MIESGKSLKYKLKGYARFILLPLPPSHPSVPQTPPLCQDGWEDIDGMEGIDKTIAEVIKDSEKGWNVKLGRWAKVTGIEEKRDCLKL